MSQVVCSWLAVCSWLFAAGWSTGSILTGG